MPDPSEVDRVRSIVTAQAQAILSDLQQAGDAPRPGAAVCAAAGWSVLVSVFPTPAGEVPGLTDCDRDCLALLAQAQEPLSAARVRRQLERQHIAIHAEITVKRSLAKLKRAGLVCNSRRRARGYYLPDNLPLFVRRPE